MLSHDLVEKFNQLINEARASGEPEPEAMNVATLDPDGRLSSRVVLLKGFDARGMVFYTNTLSRKGQALAAHPRAAVCFHWKQLRDGVQVRAEGLVEAVTPEEADAYFATRPRGSQIGAWASEQSQPMPARSTFEDRIAEVEQRFDGQTVPRPPHWSGYRVLPERMEFWFGARFRLHERECYVLMDGQWQQDYLFP
ncbi:pyridoxamine 5'-phosphate oxidase [Ahniella affigens]|uniref:Pyridoxine/pyridoxamine 5'-phosphate oxidase n=1 Tax=Ahniella affigens TaxID=2021234 RepID=A0A2P1PRJ9_9GAMM|nr:pyridoxamine 5'-phosphate oxidase [Ahniella affigens]AVP97476.1 pyridoxamine 5'-phosphate oxidase [Ahniella affigens]